MSQRGNSCHYPEVTIQLNHYFYFIFTREARTKPKGPAATLGSIVWPDVASHRLWSHIESSWALSLLQHPCWTTTGLCGVNPHITLSTVLVQEDWGAPAPPPGWAELWLCIVFRSWSSTGADGLGFEHSIVLASGNVNQVDRSHAHSDSIELSQYPLYTELEFKLWGPQDHSWLQGSN